MKLINSVAALLSASLPTAASAQVDHQTPPIVSASTTEVAAGPSNADAHDIVVVGHPPHCKQLPGERLDAISTVYKEGDDHQQVIRRDWTTGQYGMFKDDYPVTGATFWQRVGNPLDGFRFRSPEEGELLCIGSKKRFAPGFAQLRRAFDAKPYRRRVIRFTAFVGTWNAGAVTFWLASGEGKYIEGKRVKLGVGIVAGGSSQAKPLNGTHGWIPISYTIGPIPDCSTQISYGVTLEGGGDVWIYKPTFEVIPDDQLSGPAKHSGGADRNCREKATLLG